MKKPPPSFLKLEQTWKIFVAIRKNFGLLTLSNLLLKYMPACMVNIVRVEQLVAEVYARMHGKYCKGISTSMRSDLQLQDVVSSEDKTMD